MFKHIAITRVRGQSGQSTVEYIILVTAVVGVIILFMTGQNSLFSQKMSNTLGTTTNQIKDKADVLSESHNTDPMNHEDSKITVDPTQNIF